MRTLDINQATAPLAEYACGADREPVIVTRDGEPIAALVPIENADVETIRLSTHPRFLSLIERSRKRHEAEGGISPDEMRRRLGLHPM